MTTFAPDAANPPYRDASRPVEERVNDLLARITQDEKLAQLGSAWVYELADDGHLTQKGRERLRLGIGHVTRVSGASDLRPAAAATLANEIQRHVIDSSRLGIPAIVHEESCAGFMAREATIFPQAIGVASSFRPDLAEAMADVVRAQMRACGAHQGLAPLLDVCRDPRWGRIEETYGEDPYLVARMGVAFVRGLQGDLGTDGVLATGKHFVGYGVSEGGMNWAPAHIAPRELREVYLYPFEVAIREASLRSVMNGYHELDGVPCGASRELLTEILRGEWGFDGTVVSDYFSVDQLHSYHRVTTDQAEAAAQALRAGIDVELPSTDCYDGPLRAALDAGLASQDDIDEAVRRVLRAKFELGLFEDPYVDEQSAVEVFTAESTRRLARDIAQQSLVLLENDGVLPLSPSKARVAVIGPNAASGRHLLGDYSYPSHIETLIALMEDNPFGTPLPDRIETADADRVTSVLAALRERLDGTVVTTAPGCETNGDASDGFEDAVTAARDADVAIMIMGDLAGLTLECTSGESRDRSSLELPGRQAELVEAVAATGTPVVLVLVVGRPVSLARLREHCAAILMAWLPGEEGGRAIADVLTGDVSPGGKLPVSFPRSVGQIPVFYSHKASGGRSHWHGDYVDGSTGPLYPFGFGRSYTTFVLEDAEVAGTSVSPDGELVARVTVRNTGERAGDEVVQLYTRDPVASVTRPVLELRAFKRVRLEPGRATRVSFHVPVAQLGFYDGDMRYVVEAGELEVLLGRSSEDIDARLPVNIEGDGRTVVARAFAGRVELSPQ